MKLGNTGNMVTNKDAERYQFLVIKRELHQKLIPNTFAEISSKLEKSPKTLTLTVPKVNLEYISWNLFQTQKISWDCAFNFLRTRVVPLVRKRGAFLTQTLWVMMVSQCLSVCLYLPTYLHSGIYSARSYTGRRQCQFSVRRGRRGVGGGGG